jgi:hypothetical protein
MTRIARTAAVLLVAPAVLLSGCGGASEADREVCDAATDLSFSKPQAGLAAAKPSATEILRQLSGYAPDDDRLVRAVDRARDDAQAIIDGFSPLSFPKVEGGVAALEGSLSAVQAVCNDLGA